MQMQQAPKPRPAVSQKHGAARFSRAANCLCEVQHQCSSTSNGWMHLDSQTDLRVPPPSPACLRPVVFAPLPPPPPRGAGPGAPDGVCRQGDRAAVYWCSQDAAAGGHTGKVWLISLASPSLIIPPSLLPLVISLSLLSLIIPLPSSSHFCHSTAGVAA
jgi:hypothetical protein